MPVNLDELRRKVERALRDKFGFDDEHMIPWLADFWDEYIVAEMEEGAYWQIPYSVTDEGVEFADRTEWVKVESQRIWVEAKAKLMEPAGKPAHTTPSLAVKALREENGGVVVGGYLLLWGDAEHKDLQGDYFTTSTWLGLSEYPSVPALFHHGLDGAVGLAVMGKRVKAQADDTGVWVEDWLNKASQYWNMVKPLLDAEALYYSPGSAPHMVKRAADGELLAYPVVEDTFTPIPAQHRLRERPVEQIKAAYKAAGLSWPDLDGSAGAPESGEEKARLLAAIEVQLKSIELEEQL